LPHREPAKEPKKEPEKGTARTAEPGRISPGHHDPSRAWLERDRDDEAKSSARKILTAACLHHPQPGNRPRRIGRRDESLMGNLGSAKIGLGAFFHCLNWNLHGVTEGDRIYSQNLAESRVEVA
jgi:hypothetical protein